MRTITRSSAGLAYLYCEGFEPRLRLKPPTELTEVIMCCEDFGETTVVSQLVQRETDMQQILDNLEVHHVAENCWTTASAREPEPLLALEPRSHHSEHLMFGEQELLGDLEVNIDELVPTQATVKKTFTDGRSLLETMVHLVQHPEEFRRLPPMRAAYGISCLLGRRSPFRSERQVWFSADNRRCFVLKVVAPLCQISKLRISRVNWTDEFDAKLGQCPQLDAWATDQPNIEAVRNEVIHLVLNEIPPERPLKFARRDDRDGRTFDPETGRRLATEQDQIGQAVSCLCSLEGTPAQRRRKLLSWAEHKLRQRDLELSIYLEVVVKHLTTPGATVGSRILWPMLRCFLLRCLPRSVCMVLWDHLILSWREPWQLLLAALSILRCKRQMLLHLSPSQSGDKVLKLIMSATETDPAELLKNFHALRADIRSPRDMSEVKELWSQDFEDLEVIESEVMAQEGVLEGKDKETQTEEMCLEAADFARLFADLAVEEPPTRPQDATAEPPEAHEDLVTEAEKNEFLRFRAAIHSSGDASAEQSTVLPSAGPTVLETEIKAGLARLDTSLDSTTMDFQDFSDSGMEVCSGLWSLATEHSLLRCWEGTYRTAKWRSSPNRPRVAMNDIVAGKDSEDVPTTVRAAEPPCDAKERGFSLVVNSVLHSPKIGCNAFWRGLFSLTSAPDDGRSAMAAMLRSSAMVRALRVGGVRRGSTLRRGPLWRQPLSQRVPEPMEFIYKHWEDLTPAAANAQSIRAAVKAEAKEEETESQKWERVRKLIQKHLEENPMPLSTV
eukprot:s132_g36.t3